MTFYAKMVIPDSQWYQYCRFLMFQCVNMFSCSRNAQGTQLKMISFQNYKHRHQIHTLSKKIWPFPSVKLSLQPLSTSWKNLNDLKLNLNLIKMKNKCSLPVKMLKYTAWLKHTHTLSHHSGNIPIQQI